MKRRDFLKVAAGVPVLAVGQSTRSLGASQIPMKEKKLAPGSPAKVYLSGTKKGAEEKEIKLAVRSSAEAATDFSWLSRGDSVFIKPAANSGNPYPATTSPIAVAAMVELLREKGAGRVIVGDMSGVQYVRFTPTSLRGSSRKLMESSGMAKVVQAAGAELHFFEESGWDSFYEDVPATSTYWKRPLMMPNILKEVQHIILMPRCARHMLAGSTLGMKAAVGYWRHDTRLEYHRDAATLQEKTAEGNTVETLRTKQRLVISAADKILTVFGPDNGYVFEPPNGLVIASQSVVAHDMVSLAWLLENRNHIPQSEKHDFRDNSQWFARLGNHAVVNWLSGWGTALASETLTKNDLNNIWDDRVLIHACEVFGGVPEIILEQANKEFPEDLKMRLGMMTAYQA
ncbi:MAG: DUF362 domain-containing protein [Smithella sp.]